MFREERNSDMFWLGSCGGTRVLGPVVLKILLMHACLCLAFSYFRSLQTWPVQREAGGDVHEGRTGGEETTISIVEVCAVAPESDLDLSW